MLFLNKKIQLNDQPIDYKRESSIDKLSRSNSNDSDYQTKSSIGETTRSKSCLHEMPTSDLYIKT